VVDGWTFFEAGMAWVLVVEMVVEGWGRMLVLSVRVE
jgi:hypothetical protein